MRVTLAGFKSASRNGDVGTIASYDAWKARYAVKMEGDAGMMAISPGNLRQHPNVTLWELSLREINGEAGTIVSLDEEKARYNVRLENQGNAISLKPGNVVLTAGHRRTHVWSEGRELQRSVGDRREARRRLWEGKGELMMSNAETVKVKLENVIV